jgi:DNA-binding NarL/FixJ family response regulator
MPKMSGAELARQVLAQAPDTRVVVMSGFSPTWTLERLRELGVRDLLAKPISAVELSRCLRTVLESTAQRAL